MYIFLILCLSHEVVFLIRKQGLSSSLEELPIRTEQANGKVDASTLPKGLGYENDHGKHVLIYPAKDIKFGEYQTKFNSMAGKIK
nr:hypothetical protein F987_01985 [Acinetobacter gyllenbergii NIPH 230]